MNHLQKMTIEKITLQDLDFQEQKVLEETRKNFPNYFCVAEKGINLYLEFIKELLEQIPISNIKLEHYAYLQSYKNLYTIKLIYNSINFGYYFDAMNLLRSALESVVTTLFLSKNPQNLEQAIMDPKKFQNRFKIRKRFEVINYPGGYNDYQNLCSFSHPATLNIISAFSATPLLDLFPYGITYKEENAYLCIYLFLRHLGMLLDCMQYIFRSIIERKNPKLLKVYVSYLKELEVTVNGFGQGLTKFRDQYLKLYNVKI